MGLIAEEERQKELQLMEDFHSTATNVVTETVGKQFELTMNWGKKCEMVSPSVNVGW